MFNLMRFHEVKIRPSPKLFNLKLRLNKKKMKVYFDVAGQVASFSAALFLASLVLVFHMFAPMDLVDSPSEDELSAGLEEKFGKINFGGLTKEGEEATKLTASKDASVDVNDI